MPATRLALLLAVLAMMQVVTAAAGRADVERLDILNCGEGVAGRHLPLVAGRKCRQVDGLRR